MGNSIFDWDDDEEKQEPVPPAKPVEQPSYLQPPPSPLETIKQPDNSWNNEPWNDPWQEVAPEQRHWDTPAVEYVQYEPDNADETARRGGMAWSAGIVFFSSVAFMLLFGWVVDYLLQVSPWGIVGGIILGSIIGFIQFFRISSQIFDPAKHESAMRPLMPRDDDER